MNLSNDLIAQFVKGVSNKSAEKKESIIYGTVKIVDGKTFAQLDGSELLTPVNATASTKEGDRVVVMIKNHAATITGNITAPSTSNDYVNDIVDEKIEQFNIVVADKITTDELNAINATIENLKVKLLEVSKLEVVDAEIESLIAKFAELEYITADEIDAITANIESLQAKFGQFEDISTEDLSALNGYIQQLHGYTAEFTYVTADVLKALKAEIKQLDVDKLNAKDAELKYALISELDAAKADINTLIFGTATGTTISTQFANAIIAVLANAQIKSAMIDSLSADKITAGSIKTNLVDIVSEDGKMTISDETIQISDGTRARVQIGKDASNDYSITVWDADGNVMFSHDGITDKAIKDAIIRNDMVAQDANISADKLDISSLFKVINDDGSHTLKSSKILVDADNQTLDVIFEDLKSTINEGIDEITAQGTKLSIVENKIDTKVWQNDIDEATKEINTNYSSLEQSLTEFKTEVGKTYVTGEAVEEARSVFEQEVNSIKMTVNDTFAGASDPDIQSGTTIVMTDIDETGKNATVTIEGEGIDPTTKGTLRVVGPNAEASYEIVADGTPFNISLFSPETTITVDIEGAVITCEREQNPFRSLESSIQLLRDSFKTLVRGQNGETIMTQDENGWFFDINNVEDTIKSAADKVKEEILDSNDSVNESIDGFKEQLGALTSRVYIGDKTPDGEVKPCIYIQEKDSSFKICITNEYIGFYEDTSKLLWITNKRINADSIVVNEELSLGNEHTWKKRSVKSRVHTSLVFTGSPNLFRNTDIVQGSSEYEVASYQPKTPLVAGETYTVTVCWTPAPGVTRLEAYLSRGNAYVGYFNSNENYIQREDKISFTCAYESDMTPSDNIENGYLHFYRFPDDGSITGTTIIHWIRVTKGGN